MGKFDGLLFCTDLDGTLYRDDKTVSDENLAAIEYFKSEGGLFTFVTGRVPQTVEKICTQLKPNAPLGCVNGGVIYDYKSGECLYKKMLAPSAFDFVARAEAEIEGLGIQMSTEREIIFSRDNDALRHFRSLTGVPYIARDYRKINEPVFKVIFASEDEADIKRLQDLFYSSEVKEDFEMVRSERILCDLLPKGIKKGTALLKLAEILGIKWENTVAVGDFYNDVSMIEAACHGIAVENAVDAAKSVAKYISVSNNENAIADIIYNYLSTIEIK